MILLVKLAVSIFVFIIILRVVCRLIYPSTVRELLDTSEKRKAIINLILSLIGLLIIVLIVLIVLLILLWVWSL